MLSGKWNIWQTSDSLKRTNSESSRTPACFRGHSSLFFFLFSGLPLIVPSSSQHLFSSSPPPHPSLQSLHALMHYLCLSGPALCSSTGLHQMSAFTSGKFLLSGSFTFQSEPHCRLLLDSFIVKLFIFLTSGEQIKYRPDNSTKHIYFPQFVWPNHDISNRCFWRLRT